MMLLVLQQEGEFAKLLQAKFGIFLIIFEVQLFGAY
jgi:hypothetical protein